MGRLKFVSGFLAVLAVSVIVVGGTGFSQMSGERGMQVAVVSDEDAYIGYDTPNENATVTSGDSVTLVEVTNQAEGEIDVEDVTVEGANGIAVELADFPTGIATGTSAGVDATLTCSEDTTTTLAVTVTMSGDALQAQIFGDTRTFVITCEPPAPTVTDVWFTGEGNAFIYPQGQMVETRVLGYNNGNITYDQTTTINTSKSVRADIGSTDAATIVAVYIPEDGVTYYHPGYDYASGTLTSSSAGDGIPVHHSPDN